MKKLLIIIGLLVLVGVPIGIFILCCQFSSFDASKSYGLPELIYYAMQSVGVFVMAATVATAIFGPEIRRFFFGEKCSVELTDDGGLTENLESTFDTENPEAQHYDCNITISNIGNREISKCQILLKEVMYKREVTDKFKSIHKYENHTLYWQTPDNMSHSFVMGETYTLPMFRIYPENSCQTPDDSEYSHLRMRIIGCRLEEKYEKKGVWKMCYQVKSKNKLLQTFEIIVQWDGTWHSRITEMSDVVNVNLKEI